ncbi:MAG: glycosyltransferase, partial [Bacilli bacterium]|nr:glycosyltransferase [Bacilli bacterium]
MKIAMCCNNNWLHYLMVSIYSLLETNNVLKIYLFLEVDFVKELTFFKKRYNVDIEIINYKKLINKYIHEGNKNRFTQYSEATLVRLLISKALNEDKVIYIDVDAIVIDDISFLWKLDMKENYIAGVMDLNIKNYLDYLDLKNIPEDSVNAGILVMNLKAISHDQIDDKFFKLLAENTYRFPDQDVINIACQEKVLYLDNSYNSSSITGFAKQIKILHYASPKKDWVKNLPYADMWYDWEEKYLQALKTKDQYFSSSNSIDIIIRAYNSHKHIRKALDSIVRQTIKDKIHVIIVNDGSDDDYSSVIDEYKNELNLKEITLKRNTGFSNALQVGIDHTTSEYFLNLDSDDELYDKTSIESLYNLMERNPKVVKATGKVKVGDNLSCNLTYLHGKMFRRSFIQKNKIRVIPLYVYEDLAFNLWVEFLLNDEMQVFYEKCVYVYYQKNEGSITSVNNNFLKIRKAYIKAYSYALDKTLTRKGYLYAQTMFEALTNTFYDYKENKKSLSESEYIA